MTRSQGRQAGIGCAAMVACATLLSTAALAGVRYGTPGVVITRDSDGGGFASGTLGGTRNSANNVERLSCAVSRMETVGVTGAPTRSTLVTCLARDKAGVAVSCVSRLEADALVLDGVSNDALIEFRFDLNAQCTAISVYESSSLERKRP